MILQSKNTKTYTNKKMTKPKNLFLQKFSAKKNYLKFNYTNKRFCTPYDKNLLEYILNIGKIASQGSVLDLACGPGSFKAAFEEKKIKYFGVDIDNEDSLNNISRCDIGREPLPYPNESFMLVFFKMGIEHLTIKEISHCLNEARRVLESKGKLIVMTPDWEWTYKIFFEEYTHQTPFTKKSLKSALQMSGFKCEICQTIIQLPLIWRLPFLKAICNLAALFYPIAGQSIKFIKYSKVRALLAISSKS